MEPRGSIDAQLKRDAESLRRRERESREAREREAAARHRTPESGGLRLERSPSGAQPLPVEVRELPPSSLPPTRGDWSKLGFKVGGAIAAALVTIVGALTIWAVTAINANADAAKAAKVAQKQKAEELAEYKTAVRQWSAVVTWILDCRDRRNIGIGEQLLPDLNKMGSVRKPEPWRNDCPTSLPPPP